MKKDDEDGGGRDLNCLVFAFHSVLLLSFLPINLFLIVIMMGSGGFPCILLLSVCVRLLYVTGNLG